MKNPTMRGHDRLQRLALGALLCLGTAGAAYADYPAVTQQRLDDAASSNQWLTYYHSYDGDSHSPLKQVDATNVKNLKMVWSHKFPKELTQGFEATPIINGDYMFVTTPLDQLFAFDATTGKVRWSYDLKPEKIALKTVCCDVVNRGVALYGDNLYMAMLNGNVTSFDAQTGKINWTKQLFDPGIGYAFSLAPLVANDKVYVGSSGGEYGARGFIAALDAKTGDTKWKQFTVPAPDEKYGDTWPKGAYEHAGSPAWITGTYDPQSKTLYWGVGNPGPWLADLRPGKNLYSDSLLALNGDTGDINWHFQYTQHDSWDYDGVNTALRANVHYEGKDYDALIHADRNGFFHAIDRTTGKLIYAKPFVKTESVLGYDKNGESINDPKKYPKVGTTIKTCPEFLGGKNWWSMSYDPETHIAVVPAQHACGSYSGTRVAYAQGLPYLGEGFGIFPEPGSKGYGEVQGIDVDTGKKVWGYWSKTPWNGGVTTTASGIAFSGSLEGNLYAFDTRTGKVLWKSPQLASGIVAQPSVYEVNGKEYVAILTGYGGANPIWGGPMAKMTEKYPRGGTLYVFALGS